MILLTFLLTFLKIAFLFLFIFLILLLSVPFQYRMSGQKGEDYHLTGRLSWLWNGVSFAIEVNSQDRAILRFTILGLGWTLSPASAQPGKKRPQKGETANSKGSRVFKHYLLKKSFLHHAYTVGKDFLNHFKPKVFEARGRIGFEDPYHTGLFCALWYPLARLSAQSAVDIEPVFEAPCLIGQFCLEGKFIIGVILFLGLKMLRPLPVFKIMKELKEENSYAV